jgi:hypothetical protein
VCGQSSHRRCYRLRHREVGHPTGVQGARLVFVEACVRRVAREGLALPLSGALIAFDQSFCRQPDVLCDLAQQGRRDVASGVKRNGRPPTVCMPDLLWEPF